jgi:hypothetical protein
MTDSEGNILEIGSKLKSIESAIPLIIYKGGITFEWVFTGKIFFMNQESMLTSKWVLFNKSFLARRNYNK